MAGKADIVNGIVYGVDADLQDVPTKDGWKLPESYAGGGLEAAMSGTPPEDGSVRIIGGGGGVQG